MADGKALGVGDRASDFTLTAATGEPVRLADMLAKSEVVLYFYPKDNTPGCTAEACSFRDSHEAFREAGAAVIGVSADSADSHRRFAERFGLPFLLLSDPQGEVRDAYGVKKTLGLLPGRVTFLIDRQGVIRHVFSSQFRPAQHVKEALAVLQGLRSTSPETPAEAG